MRMHTFTSQAWDAMEARRGRAAGSAAGRQELERLRDEGPPLGVARHPRVADRVAEVAKPHGATGSQIALAWILHKPYVHSPIIGATKMDHLDQAIAALDIQLSDEEIGKLEETYQPHPILGHA